MICSLGISNFLEEISTLFHSVVFVHFFALVIEEGFFKDDLETLNAEFQRIARRDKKAFLSDQCKEIEENNKMGKSRDLFKEMRDTKGTFHAKMGSIKDRNGRDLTEAEDIKKRWQQYMEELYKQDLHDPDNYHGVITHLEPQTSWNVKSSGP